VLAYSWTVNGGSFSNTAINPTNWTAPEIPGSYRITVTVNDGKGGTDSMSKDITVAEQNKPPVVSDIIVRDRKTQVTVNYAVPGTQYDLFVNASDPDGDALTFNWNVTHGTLSNSNSNPALWASPYSTSITYVTLSLTVSDGKGGVVTRTREIEVRW